MARFFLADVAPTLSGVPGTGDLLQQLSSSALEVFAAGVDPETGRRDDRLLLVRTWNELAYQNWRLGQREPAKAALASSLRRVEPLRRQFPGDAEVLAAELEAEMYRLDLELDDGELPGTREKVEALAARLPALRTPGPPTPYALAVERLVADRTAIVLLNSGDPRRALDWARRARDVAVEHARLAPDDARAVATSIDEAVLLATLLETVGQREESLQTLRTAGRQVERLRAERDGRALKEAHANVLAQLTRSLDPERDAAEWRPALTEARRLLAEVQRTDPGRNIVLYELVLLALLDGDDEAAWSTAQRIEAMELGAEYDEAVIVAAFATGRDDVVRAKAREGGSGSPASAALWAGLLEALEGHRALARGHLSRCKALRCGVTTTWLPTVLLRRVGARDDASAQRLRQLARELPVSLADGKRLEAALERLVEDLGATP